MAPISLKIHIFTYITYMCVYVYIYIYIYIYIKYICTYIYNLVFSKLWHHYRGTQMSNARVISHSSLSLTAHPKPQASSSVLTFCPFPPHNAASLPSLFSSPCILLHIDLSQTPGWPCHLFNSKALNIQKTVQDLPGSAVAKNPPANAGNTDSSLWEDPTCQRATNPLHHNY